MATNSSLAAVTDEQTTGAVGVVAVPEILSGYRLAHAGASSAELYELFFSDWRFRIPSVELASADSRAGGTTYLYELAGDVSSTSKLSGSPHVADVPLLFDTIPESVPAASRERMIVIGNRMRQAWTRFARDGDPGWPDYDDATTSTRVFDGAGRITAYPEQMSRSLWRNNALIELRCQRSVRVTSPRAPRPRVTPIAA